MNRIQRKRTAGWKKPDNTIFVDRTNKKWGNPYKIVPAGKEWEVIEEFRENKFTCKEKAEAKALKMGNNHEVIHVKKNWRVILRMGFHPTKEDAAIKAVELFQLWVDEEIKEGRLNLSELKGKNLACFCGLNDTCHADYLLKIAANV